MYAKTYYFASMKRIVLLIAVILTIILSFYLYQSSSHTLERIDLDVNRFDKELFSINADNIDDKSREWEQNYGSFVDVFTRNIIQISSATNDQDGYHRSLLAFIQNKDMREAYDSAAVLFSDISDIIYTLEYAFGQFNIDFPSYPIPRITTFFGGFNYGVVTYDYNIGIGLENFLGKDSKFYKYLGEPKYLRFHKQKKFIASNVLEAWFNELFQKNLVSRDMLSQLIYKGKMMYFLDRMLPELNIEDKFRFTVKQMNWVQKNESSIWEFFVQEDLLFSKKEKDFRSYINYAPFAKGMPTDAPDRVAFFIGYKIVCDYIKNNKISIDELMLLTDSRKFLKKSKYKPTK